MKIVARTRPPALSFLNKQEVISEKRPLASLSAIKSLMGDLSKLMLPLASAGLLAGLKVFGDSVDERSKLIE